MTCIIGLVDNEGTVWMGADRAISGADDNYKDTSAWPKVMRRERLLIGVSGFLVHMVLLRFHDIPIFSAADTLGAWVANIFWPWWRKWPKTVTGPTPTMPDGSSFMVTMGTTL